MTGRFLARGASRFSFGSWTAIPGSTRDVKSKVDNPPSPALAHSSPLPEHPIEFESAAGVVVFKTLISLGIVVLLCVVGGSVHAETESMIYGGFALSAFGFAYGIPTAIVYHWALHRSLVRAHRLPNRWWLSPTAHHGSIPPTDRRLVLTWAAIGGSGFLVIVLGILITTIGLWKMLGP
jgi:hypothetical protein